MRILAIRGENLASLAKKFEIDLTSEPLAGTGLFAITGDTGAGKSTILDALCVALYGDYPRVAVEQREKAPDPSGTPIGAGDARGLLRRGASCGFAEVDFVGVDGEACRVRWAVARARGKATGNLQKEQRLLSRLACGSAIADGITPVRAAVETRTGLTFQQFRRTVLLAQGEFDAFLLANENDRADLLEKITGTEIYARISARVNAGTRTLKTGLEMAEARCRQIGVMEPAARDALLAERADKTAEAARTSAALDSLEARLAHTESVLRAQASLAAAEAALGLAAEADGAAAADRGQLQGLRSVEPLRPVMAAVRCATERQAQAVAEATAARRLRNAARGDEEQAIVAFGAASAAGAVAERDMQSFAPVWAVAERLDTEIGLAAAELEAALDAARQAGEQVEAGRTELASLDSRIIGLKQACAETSATAISRKQHALLSERADDIAKLLARRHAIAGQRTAAETARLAAASQCEALSAQIKAAEKGGADHKIRRHEVVRQIASHSQALAEIDKSGHAARDVRLGQLQEVLREARPIADEFREARRAGDEAAAEAARAGQAAVAAEGQLAHARAEHDGLIAARREITALVDLADAMQRPAVAELRSVLVGGEPCPVCGGTSHPYAGGDHLEAPMVAHIQQRRGALDAGLAAIESRITDCSGAHADAAARQAAAGRARQSADVVLAERVAAFAEVAPRLAAAHRASDWPSASPVDLEAGTAAVFAGMLCDVTAARHALAGPLAAAQRLRAEIESLRHDDDRLARTIETAERQIKEQTQALHAAESAHLEARMLVGGLDRQIGELTADLAAPLDCAGLAVVDLDRDPAGVALRLREVGAEYAALSARAIALQRELDTCEPHLAGVRSMHEAVRAAAARTEADAARRRDAAESKRSARAQLLGGEATAAHRDTISAARTAALAALELARTARTDAQHVLAGLQERVAAASRAETCASGEAARAEVALGVSMREAGMPREEVERLLATPQAVRCELEARLAGLARTVADAEVALGTRRSDLAALIADGAPEADVAAAKAQADALAGEMELARNRIAAMTANLEADDRARGQAEQLGLEIEDKRRELAIWQAVDAAVGSANGDRFRRFAQAVTLDQLVRLANEQLAALKPRYQLARGTTSDLALHVVDRDMGCEARAVRSLSGGERFLVSLALALALSGLEGRQSFVDTLFIDEGFGSLDAETLDLAIDALETLQGHGRKVGVITHVAGMIDRIAVQIRVQRRGNGRSVVRFVGGGDAGQDGPDALQP